MLCGERQHGPVTPLTTRRSTFAITRNNLPGIHRVLSCFRHQSKRLLGRHVSFLVAICCSAIKNATTAERLQQLAEIHVDTINQIHIAAILTKLANISKRAQQQPVATTVSASIYAARSAASQRKLLQQLQAQLLQQGCRGHGPRGLSNILWALAKLQCNPDLALLRVLICNFYHQLPTAVPQDVANGKIVTPRCSSMPRTPEMPPAPGVIQVNYYSVPISCQCDLK